MWCLKPKIPMEEHPFARQKRISPGKVSILAFWHTVFWSHTIPYPIWPTLPPHHRSRIPVARGVCSPRRRRLEGDVAGLDDRGGAVGELWRRVRGKWSLGCGDFRSSQVSLTKIWGEVPVLRDFESTWAILGPRILGHPEWLYLIDIRRPGDGNWWFHNGSWIMTWFPLFHRFVMIHPRLDRSQKQADTSRGSNQSASVTKLRDGRFRMHLGLCESGVPLTPLVQIVILPSTIATIGPSHHFQTHPLHRWSECHGAMVPWCPMCHGAQCLTGGHYEFPYLPEIPGETAWLAASEGSEGSEGSGGPGGRRRVVHAVHYDDPAPRWMEQWSTIGALNPQRIPLVYSSLGGTKKRRFSDIHTDIHLLFSTFSREKALVMITFGDVHFCRVPLWMIHPQSTAQPASIIWVGGWPGKASFRKASPRWAAHSMPGRVPRPVGADCRRSLLCCGCCARTEEKLGLGDWATWSHWKDI